MMKPHNALLTPGHVSEPCNAEAKATGARQDPQEPNISIDDDQPQLPPANIFAVHSFKIIARPIQRFLKLYLLKFEPPQPYRHHFSLSLVSLPFRYPPVYTSAVYTSTVYTSTVKHQSSTKPYYNA